MGATYVFQDMVQGLIKLIGSPCYFTSDDHEVIEKTLHSVRIYIYVACTFNAERTSQIRRNVEYLPYFRALRSLKKLQPQNLSCSKNVDSFNAFDNLPSPFLIYKIKNDIPDRFVSL